MTVRQDKAENLYLKLLIIPSKYIHIKYIMHMYIYTLVTVHSPLNLLVLNKFINRIELSFSLPFSVNFKN